MAGLRESLGFLPTGLNPEQVPWTSNSALQPSGPLWPMQILFPSIQFLGREALLPVSWTKPKSSGSSEATEFL